MNGSILLAEFHQRLQIDAVLVVEASTNFSDANYSVSGFMHELCSVGADIAEALDDDSGPIAVDIQLFASLIADDHHAAASRLAAATGSADVDGLAGYHRGHGLPHVHGVGIHHPGHDLFVGIDVGSGNVFFWTDEFDQLCCVAARHALDFAHRHLVRIA